MGDIFDQLETGQETAAQQRPQFSDPPIFAQLEDAPSVHPVVDMHQQASQLDASKAIDIGKLARENPEIDPRYIELNLPQLKRVASAPVKQAVSDVANTFKKTASFLSDPRNMVRLHEFLPDLIKPEKIISSASGFFDKHAANLATGILNQEYDAARYDEIVGNKANGFSYATNALRPTMTPAYYMGITATDPADRRKQIEELRSAIGSEAPTDGSIASQFIETTPMLANLIARSATGAAIGGLVGLAGGPTAPGFAAAGGAAGVSSFFYKSGFVSTYDQLSQVKTYDGQPLPQNVILTASVISGALQGGLSIAGIGRLLPATAPKSIIAALSTKEALREAAVTMLKEAGHTSATMAAFTGAEMATTETAKAVGGVDPQYFASPQDVLRNAYGAAIEGPLVFSPLIGFNAARGLRKNLSFIESTRNRAVVNPAIVVELDKEAKESPVRSKDEVLYREHIETVADGSRLEKAIISKEGFEKVAAEKGKDPAMLAVEVGIQEQYTESIKSGKPLEMPLALFQSKVMDEYRLPLANDVKFDHNDFTFNELSTEVKRVSTENKASQEKIINDSDLLIAKSPETKAGYETVREDIKSKLLSDENLRIENFQGAAGTEKMTADEFKTHVEDISDLVARRWTLEAEKQQKPVEEVYGEGVRIQAAEELKPISEQPASASDPSQPITSGRQVRTRGGPLDSSVTEHPVFVKAHSEASPILAELGIDPTNGPEIIRAYQDLHGQMHDLVAEAKKKPTPERLAEISRLLNEIGAKEVGLIRISNIITDPNSWLNFYEKRDAGLDHKAPKDTMRKFFQGENKPRAQYIPSERLIELFKTKDPTSFAHESAHDWLQDMFKHVKAGVPTDAYRADWSIVSNFLGVKDGQKSITTAQHEKFAKSWETYLSEGKAPSPALREVFQRFAEWITKVYGDVKKALGIELTDEMRGFFDRQIATSEEIAAARRDVGLDGQTEGLSASAVKEISELQTKARHIAEDALMRPRLDEIRAQTKSNLASERARLTQEITNQVNQEPVFKAISFMGEKKRNIAYWKEASDYINNKLDAASKESFETIAEIAGFTSADEMARQILLTDPKEAIRLEVKKRVAEAMAPKIPTKAQLREQALEAVHNDSQTELLALESRALVDLLAKRADNEANIATRRNESSVLAQAVKDDARRTLLGRNLSEAVAFRPYYTAERNAASRYARAMARGDIKAAQQAKSEQLHSHALATEALRIKNDVNRLTKELVEAQRADPKAFKTEEHFSQAAQILGRFGFERNDFIGNQRRETLVDWATRMQEKTDNVDIPNWILNEATSKAYKDLTPQELKDIRDAVVNIRHVANHENKAYAIFDKLDMQDIAKVLIKTQIEEANNKKGPKLSLHETWFDKLVNQKDTFNMQLITAETWLRKLDGYKNFGPWWRAFFEQYTRGADVKSQLSVEAANKYSEIFGVYDKNEIKAMNDKKFIPEINDSLMKSEIITIALNMGSESNKERLLEGRGWTDDQVRNILNREMTKKDWDTVQKTWNFIDSYWPKIAELYKDLTGFTPEKVERSPINTPHGKYDGGYFPLRFDPRTEMLGMKQLEVDASLNESPASWRASTKNGFSKARVDGAKYRVSMDIGGIQRHVTDVIHDLTMRKWVLDANRLLMREDIRNSIVDAIGQPGYKMFDDWVKAVAGTNGYQSREFLGDFFHQLRRRTVLANLGLRVSSAILQIDDLGAYGRVDPKNFGVKDATRGVMSLYGKVVTNPSEYKRAVDFVYDKSKYMAYERATNIDRDIRDAANKAWGKEDKMGKFSMSLVVGMDHLLSIPVWTEAYKKGLQIYEGSEQKAVDYADNIIRRAQSSGRTGELAAIMRGSEKQKALTMFYSFMNKRLNLWYEQIDKTHGFKDLPELAGTAAALWIAPTLFSSFVHMGLPDNDEKIKKYIKDQLNYFPGLFPVVRDVSDFLLDKAMGLRSFGYQVTPVARSVETAGAMLANPSFENAARAGAYAVPYPDQINAWIFNLADIITGEMSPRPSDAFKRRPKRERD